MSKLILKTSTKTVEFNFTKVILQTSKYRKQIKSTSLHVGAAAKIIIKDSQLITTLLLLQPMIISDENNNITIWTKSSMENSTLLLPYLNEEIKKANKIDNKIFKSKKIIGLLPEEQWRFVSTEAMMEIIKLANKKLPLDQGGGF